MQHVQSSGTYLRPSCLGPAVLSWAKLKQGYTHSWPKWGCAFCLKSFQIRRVSATGLLTSTSTLRSIIGLILQPLKSFSTFTQTAKLWQGLGIQTNSRCSLGIMKMFSHLTVCLQRAMSAQAQEQALIIRALPECNGVTQWAPCPRRAGSQGRPGQVASQEVDASCGSCAKPQ